jgi:hypothetical protein
MNVHVLNSRIFLSNAMAAVAVKKIYICVLESRGLITGRDFYIIHVIFNKNLIKNSLDKIFELVASPMGW